MFDKCQGQISRGAIGALALGPKYVNIGPGVLCYHQGRTLSPPVMIAQSHELINRDKMIIGSLSSVIL